MHERVEAVPPAPLPEPRGETLDLQLPDEIVPPLDPATLAVIDDAVLATMYDDAPVGIAVLDLAGRYVHVNETIARRNGRTPAAHIGSTLEDVLGDSAPAVRAQLDRVVLDRRPVPEEDVQVVDGAGIPRTWRVTWFPARDRSGEVRAAVCIAADVTEQRRAEAERDRAQERTALLARSGELLAAGLSVEQALDAVVDLIVPALGDWCVIHMVAPSGAIHGARALHREPELSAALAELFARFPISTEHPYGAGYAIATGATQTLPAVTEEVLQAVGAGDEQFLGLMRRLAGNGIIVPLRARGRTLGAVSVARDGGPVMVGPDVSLVEDIVRRAALALDNARLYEQQRELAVTLQRSLLPRSLPSLPTVSLCSRYLPGADGTEVGGDFYDAVLLPDGRLGLTVGDVMGRGVRAAAVMGQLRAALRGYALEGHPPDGVLRRVDALVQALEDGELVTAVYGVLDPATGDLQLASAGHPGPVHLHADGRVTTVELDPGPPLGVGHLFAEVVTLRLAPGDTALFFTDGLVEDRSMPVYEGIDTLVEALRQTPDRWRGTAEGACAAALRAMNRGPDHDDDIALLAVAVSG